MHQHLHHNICFSVFWGKKKALKISLDFQDLSEVPTRFELVIKVLQTFALPLGYGTIFINDSDGNRTRVTAVKGRCLNLLTTEPNTSGSTL